MMTHHRFARTILLLALCTTIINASSPSSHLLPPPPSTYRRLPPPSPVIRKAVEPPGIMSRIAKWFGFDEPPKEQQLQGSYYQPRYKEPPHTNYQYTRSRAPCNLCNVDPWIPMFPGNLQYPVLKSEQPSHPQIKFNYHPNNNNFESFSQHIPLPNYRPQPNHNVFHKNEYAPAYNFPPLKPAFRPFPNGGFRPPNSPPFSKNPSPIPLPNLSQTPIPPLYDYVPFRNYPQNNHIDTIVPIHNEAFPSQIPPSQTNGGQDASIEIIKSVPLTEFVSSVEYPASIVQSPIVDITVNTPSSTLPPPPQPSAVTTEQSYHTSPSQSVYNNYQSSSFPQPSEQNLAHHSTVTTPFPSQTYPTTDNFGTVSPPQVLDNHLSQGIPQLTELGSYSPNLVPQQQTFFTTPIIAHTEPDNHVAASSHNVSYRNENNREVGNFINQVDNFYESSTLRLAAAASGLPLTAPDPPTTIPSIVPFEPHAGKKNRETPKYLLDSPIYHKPGSSPRPFTRDPSDLQFRSTDIDHPNSLYQSSSTPTPWAFVPTPTSSYNSQDASGLYAGISPPSLYQSTPKPFEYRSNQRGKHIKQIVIPYTIDNKPTPFKVRVELNDPPEEDERYYQWAHSQDQEIHEQQESKVVTATQSPGVGIKATKYLTKILAANLRDLLKREHEHKNKSKHGFDIVKLQKNIDDWTQQEFTSHSHKGSTVSARGRSKNIPSEYLTTTPSLTQQRLAKLATEESTTTRSYATLLENTELHKYDTLTRLAENNRIETVESRPQHSSTTTTEDSHISVLYPRTVPITAKPQELWNQLKVSISPLTKEKVYVVTPQSVANQRVEISTKGDSVGTFKSPRFLVRPTPGASPGQKMSNNKTFTPELFGLMGVSAYSPPAPVETFDGHSKVITIVTPSGFSKKRAADSEVPSSAGPSTTPPKSH